MPITPSREPENHSETNWLKKLGLTGFVALVLIKVFARMTAGVAVTEGEVALSKYSSWPKDYRDAAVSSCEKEAMKSFLDAPGAKSYSEFQLRQMASSYCTCMVEKVEAAHIVKSKFNRLTESEETAAKDVEASINAYLETSEGKSALAKCVQSARTASGEPSLSQDL